MAFRKCRPSPQAMSRPNWKAFYRDAFGRHWRELAGEYQSLPYHRKYQEITFSLLDAHKGDHVLACGVGTGILAARLLSSGVRLSGIDISHALAVECASFWEGLSLTGQCAQADVEGLPFGNDCFDGAMASSVLWYLPSPFPAVDEMLRVTRPGGRVVFDIMNAWHTTGLTIFFWRRLQRFFGWERGLISLASSHYMSKALRARGIRFSVYGFFILLPTAFPILWERANICKHFPTLSFGLSRSRLRHFGAKLLYLCEV